MTTPTITDRRSVLKLLAASAAGPLILPGRLFGADAPSKKITIGCIGVGWQGTENLQSFLGQSDCQVVAVCDVDEKHLNEAIKRVNDHYKNQDCKGYKDFEELIARNDIDAVCICTPDHWHSIPAIAAANAGKDIFCEKPLSHTLSEGIAMVNAVHKNHRIWQTGSWQRAQASFRWAAELVQNGYIGKVTRVEVGLPSGHADFEGTGKTKPDCEPPAGVDYERWIGPSQMLPFNPCRFHKNWRWNYNTGGGQLMDWIGHHNDIAHWGLANPEFGCGPDDAVGPLTVSATAEFPAKTDVWNTATKYHIECKYPNDIDYVIAGGYPEIQGGAKWIGPNGWVRADRGVIEASNKDWIREIQKLDKEGSLKVQLYNSPGHHKEFLDSVKSRKRTLTPVEIAHRSQTPGHLGYIASVVGRPLKWDAVKQEIIGDPEATALLSTKMRAPWHI
ncbi:MAG: Gfo/Idh/MocA family oxidoreductase [Verrucomicrobia bacterium]|nr:MAG: Gfo/Idh/MocA family oxidoreductase [Verrucomicrobiota bacterium]